MHTFNKLACLIADKAGCAEVVYTLYNFGRLFATTKGKFISYDSQYYVIYQHYSYKQLCIL